MTWDEYIGKLKKWLSRKEESNSTVDKKERRKELRCSYCRPNKGENQKTRKKHGVKKSKKKDHGR